MDKPAKGGKRTGRPPKFSEALLERVLERVLDGEGTCNAVRREGLSYQAFYIQLARRPDLATRLTEAQNASKMLRDVQRVEAAEEELYRRGVLGWMEPVLDAKGNVRRYRWRFSNRCLLFLLKSLKRSVYGRRPTQATTVVNVGQAREGDIIQRWREESTRDKPGAAEGSGTGPPPS